MSEPNSEADSLDAARSERPLGYRGLLALACLFGGPLLFVAGLAVMPQVLKRDSAFSLFGIVIICATLLLIPIGERLRLDTYWSHLAVHARRAGRQSRRSPGASDVLWALFALVNAFAALFALAGSVRVAAREIHRLLTAAQDDSAERWAHIGAKALGTLMIIAGVYLLTALPLTIARGSWRRTIWGWREQSSDPEVSQDTAADATNYSPQNSNTARASSRTALAMIWVLIALMVALTIATAYSLRDYRFT